MTFFSEKLKGSRLATKTTQKALADYLEISERAYQHYEAGTREPGIEKLIALADFFGVSIDYLVGRTDNPDVNK